MIRHETTFYPDSFQLKTYKEYNDGFLIEYIKYNESGKILKRVDANGYKYVYEGERVKYNKYALYDPKGNFLSFNEYPYDENNEKAPV